MKALNILSLAMALILGLNACGQESQIKNETKADTLGMLAQGTVSGLKVYTQEESFRHLQTLKHETWDLDINETLRYAHLNSPQFFTHAWVHRAGPISLLERKFNSALGQVRATSIIGDISLNEWLAKGSADGFLVLHKGKIAYERYPQMRSFDKHHWWSVRKPILSTLVAILEDEGSVDVDQPIDHYIDDLKGYSVV